MRVLITSTSMRVRGSSQIRCSRFSDLADRAMAGSYIWMLSMAAAAVPDALPSPYDLAALARSRYSTSSSSSIAKMPPPPSSSSPSSYHQPHPTTTAIIGSSSANAKHIPPSVASPSNVVPKSPISSSSSTPPPNSSTTDTTTISTLPKAGRQQHALVDEKQLSEWVRDGWMIPTGTKRASKRVARFCATPSQSSRKVRMSSATTDSLPQSSESATMSHIKKSVSQDKMTKKVCFFSFFKQAIIVCSLQTYPK